LKVIDKQLPENQQGFLGGFYIRPMSLEFGQEHQGHAHWIDHVSNIIKPPLRIEMNDMMRDKQWTIDVLVACKINIPAQTWHKFTALSEEGCAWECWFSQKEAEDKYDTPVDWNQERK
jgi:hypothetical protein